jgi:hypothetical protein
MITAQQANKISTINTYSHKILKKIIKKISRAAECGEFEIYIKSSGFFNEYLSNEQKEVISMLQDYGYSAEHSYYVDGYFLKVNWYNK